MMLSIVLKVIQTQHMDSGSVIIARHSIWVGYSQNVPSVAFPVAIFLAKSVVCPLGTLLIDED